MVQVYVGAGSNIDRRGNAAKAVALLRAKFGRLCVSPVYESEAAGFAGPRFYNFVVGFVSTLTAASVVGELRVIEESCGRVRKEGPWCSRTLDLDLLLHGQTVLDSDGLVLPRPEILTAPFILRPLAEIAAQAVHPLTKRSFAEHWAAFEGAKDAIWPVALRLDGETPTAISP